MSTARKHTLPSGLERRQQIENLRAAALALIKARPQWIKVSGRPAPTYEGDGMRIIHYTAFQGFHSSRPSGLSIWSGGKKVLNIEWDVDGKIEVVSFKRGDWERKLA
jgi:hypothetical protein